MELATPLRERDVLDLQIKGFAARRHSNVNAQAMCVNPYLHSPVPRAVAFLSGKRRILEMTENILGGMLRIRTD